MKHVNRIAQLFRFDIDFCSNHVNVKGDGGTCINAEQMGKDVLKAKEKINCIKQEHNYTLNLIRIVGIGIKLCYQCLHGNRNPRKVMEYTMGQESNSVCSCR